MVCKAARIQAATWRAKVVLVFRSLFNDPVHNGDISVESEFWLFWRYGRWEMWWNGVFLLSTFLRWRWRVRGLLWKEIDARIDGIVMGGKRKSVAAVASYPRLAPGSLHYAGEHAHR